MVADDGAADAPGLLDASAAVLDATAAVLRQDLLARVDTDPPAVRAATVPAAAVMPVIAVLPPADAGSTAWAGFLHSSFPALLGAGGEGWLGGAPALEDGAVDEAWLGAPEPEGAAAVGVDRRGISAQEDAVLAPEARTRAG